MGFCIYNSLTRRVEPFEPLEAGKVRMYVCGPTVYGHAHLGHAKSYVSFDVLLRYLRFLGYEVLYVQNITDVGHLTDDADQGEDKLAKQAQKERRHPMAIAEFYTRSYFEDMDALNCIRPDISPRATGHIPEQIELTQKLIEKGYAYVVNGSVYFDVSKFAGYGKLSGRTVEQMLAGARVEINPEKRHPADFALWKRAEPNHIMQWNSPWGRGYPGWHLECSVMSMKYLGNTIDIHGGGLENQFPHHECEIAQSEAANDCPFVKYWVHHNMVTVDGQKMGKSLGNFITLKQIFKEGHPRLTRTYDPMAVRLLILQSHYRSPLDFSDAALSAAQSGYEKLADTVQMICKRAKTAPEGKRNDAVERELTSLKEKFIAAMDDDLNTAVALSVLFEMVKLAQTVVDTADRQTAEALEKCFTTLGGDVLGLVWRHDKHNAQDEALLDHLIGLLIEQRQQARQKKDFAAADAIRDKLAGFGIILEDKPGGITSWRRA